MDRNQIDRLLTACEGGGDLREEGFWKAVAALKRDPELAAEFGGRVAAVDLQRFRAWALLRVPIRFGTVLVTFGAIVGLALIAATYYFESPWNALLLLAGFGALEATTHSLAHLAVGSAFGIRFTDWFIARPSRPQPGVKIDYVSYLATPPRQRAWMHASGAIATKLTPLIPLGAGLAAGVGAWALWIIGGVFVIQFITDALFSTKTSDWSRFRREMRYV